MTVKELRDRLDALMLDGAVDQMTPVMLCETYRGARYYYDVACVRLFMHDVELAILLDQFE